LFGLDDSITKLNSRSHPDKPPVYYFAIASADSGVARLSRDKLRGIRCRISLSQLRQFIATCTRLFPLRARASHVRAGGAHIIATEKMQSPQKWATRSSERPGRRPPPI